MSLFKYLRLKIFRFCPACNSSAPKCYDCYACRNMRNITKTDIPEVWKRYKIIKKGKGFAHPMGLERIDISHFKHIKPCNARSWETHPCDYGRINCAFCELHK